MNVLGTKIGKRTQAIQPFQFGHTEKKRNVVLASRSTTIETNENRPRTDDEVAEETARALALPFT